MSKKHVEQYYKTITDQYNEMISDIRDFEKEVANGLIEPERVERLKEQIRPLKENWERWSYMMFLLNQPQNKRKKKKYEKIAIKQISNLSPSNSIEATIEENKEVLKRIGE